MYSTASSSTVLSSTAASQAYGVPVTLVANVFECVSCLSVSGFVTFKEGNTVLGSVPVQEDGGASLEIVGLLPGAHIIKAYYSGDGTSGPSVSLSWTQTITGNANPVSPGNLTWVNSYNQASMLTKVLDPIGNLTTTSYSALNQPLSVIGSIDVGKSVPRKAIFTYDGAGNLASAADARNVSTTLTANSLGLPKTQVSPDSGTTNYTTDAAGRLQTSTDARGKVTTYGYDNLGRITSISYTTGVGTVLTYDTGSTATIGRLVGMTDESGSTSFAYDTAGRPITRTQIINGQSFVTGITWGDSGSSLNQLTSMTYPSGNVINYLYDANGRVSGITLNPVNPNGVGASGTAITLISNIAYNAEGQITGWSRGNGLSEAFAYANGMINSYDLGNKNGSGMAAGSTRTVGRDAKGRITAYSHINSGASVAALDQSFVFNNSDKLKSATIGGVTTSYGYDDGDNRTTKIVGATTYTNAIVATSNRQASFQDVGGTFVPTYDTAGNVTGDGTYTYTYSDRGRMSTSATGGVTTNYLYDATDHRVAAIAPGKTAYLQYGLDGLPTGEYDASKAPLYETIYLGGQPVAVLKQTGTAAGSNIAVTSYNVYSDHLGAPRIVTRNDNAIVWRWDNAEAYGGAPADENPNALGAFTFNLRFPGQVYDPNTGLYQNMRREYNPRLGRYMQSDPIGLGGGLNTYEYVGGSPTMFVDPTGEKFVLRYVCGSVNDIPTGCEWAFRDDGTGAGAGSGSTSGSTGRAGNGGGGSGGSRGESKEEGKPCISPSEKSAITGALSSAATAAVATRNVYAVIGFGVVGGVAGYFFGDTGGGLVTGFVAAAYSAPAGFRAVAGLIGGSLGAVSGNEGTMLGGGVGGAVDGMLNANRGVKVYNLNSFYGSGFGQMLKGGFAGAVGGYVNDKTGVAVDAINASCTSRK